MTRHRTLKRLIRARMAETGESYSVARRKIISSHESVGPSPRRSGRRRWAIPLGVLLAAGAVVAIVHVTQQGGGAPRVYEGGLITTDDITVSEIACPADNHFADEGAGPYTYVRGRCFHTEFAKGLDQRAIPKAFLIRVEQEKLCRLLPSGFAQNPRNIWCQPEGIARLVLAHRMQARGSFALSPAHPEHLVHRWARRGEPDAVPPLRDAGDRSA